MANDSTKRNTIRPRTHVAVAVVSTAGGSLLKAQNKNRLSLVIVNNHATTVLYIGNSDVTAANGIPLAAGASFTDNFSTEAWYGLQASGTGDARVAEVQ